MARILWVKHPTDPRKNNTMEHVSREAASSAIAFGYAQAAPYKNYVDRLNEDSKARTAADPLAAVVDGWGVRESRTILNGVIVSHTFGTTTLHYEGAPAHAPKWVKEKAAALIAKLKSDPSAAAKERAQREQDMREQAENAAARGVGLPPAPPPPVKSIWDRLTGKKDPEPKPEPEPVIKAFI